MKRKKVIFISGYNGHKSAPLLMRLFLGRKFKIISFNHNMSFGKIKVEKFAKQLQKYVNKLKLEKEEKVSIVGHSMGGVIAEYYPKFLDNNKVDKLITICAPFKGSPMASIFFSDRKGMKEIQKNSGFLKKLQKKKLRGVREESIYCEEDIVVPNKSGKRGSSIRSYFFIHIIIHFWPPVILEVKRFLEKK
jgi:triacylglycerol esterase/lipase EstA (alpha/beta hydrolase family)